MDKNKLALPIAIMLASLVLGGFYYAGEVSKQRSVERQQLLELQEKHSELEAKELEDKKIADQKAACVSEAQQNAIELNKERCARGEYCISGDGAYLVGQYDTSYNTCLQEHGLK
jgi:uncharacterized protein HemX